METLVERSKGVWMFKNDESFRHFWTCKGGTYFISPFIIMLEWLTKRLFCFSMIASRFYWYYSMDNDYQYFLNYSIESKTSI